MDVQSVLVPVDFSTCSMLVTRRAAALARQLGAHLTILHVAELPEGLPPDRLIRPDGVAVRADQYVEATTAARMAPYVAAALEQGVQAQAEVHAGPVVETILAAAARADLVVIGTHGRTGLARALLGSVAEEVARQSQTPVLLVRREVRPECHKASCQWCAEGNRSPEEAALDGEAEG